MAFLPMNIKEVKARGWDEVDFVYVMGDSYVDHPSFGAAIITRVLEDCGYKVAVLSQPDWKMTPTFYSLANRGSDFCYGRQYRQYGCTLYRCKA